MIDLGIYALLGILELLLLLVVGVVVLLVSWRNAKRDVERLRDQLAEVEAARSAAQKEPVEPVQTQHDSEAHMEYADYLEQELEQSSIFLGEDPKMVQAAETDSDAADADSDSDNAEEDDPQQLTRQMLAARHQFLQLELDVQGLDDTRDVEERRERIVSGMQALLEGLRGTAAESDADDEVESAVQVGDAPRAGRDEEAKLREQIDHLRSVIDNQHKVMRELRLLLEEEGGDSAELQAALKKLGAAERQGKELERCLEVMESENERLKKKGRAGAGATATAVSSGAADPDMLRDLVGSQQRTIKNLEQMLREAMPDAGKAKEFSAALDKIQRTNNELNSCVVVLEDENNMLRGEIESLQARIAAFEADTGAHADTEKGAPSAPEPAAGEAAATAEISKGATESAADAPAVAEVPGAAEYHDLAEVADAAAGPEHVADSEDVSDIDALLAAAAPAQTGRTEAPATDEASSEVPGPDATGEPATPDAPDAVKATEEPTKEAAVDPDDIDALLAASADAAAPASGAGDETPEKASPALAEAAPEKAKVPSLTENETGQDDVDALLSELFGEDNDAFSDTGESAEKKKS